MNTNAQVSAIQNILKTPTSAVSYTPSEKCIAIINWVGEENIEFDLTVVDSILDQYRNRNFATHKQKVALENIISKFNINIEQWAY